MLENLARIEREFQQALDAAGADVSAVEQVRVRFLGRKGELSGLMRLLGGLSKEEKPSAGKAINLLKQKVTAGLEAAVETAARAGRKDNLARDRVDVTLPPRTAWAGAIHPTTHCRRELEKIFRGLGYSVESGPEVEDDFHNFQALNMPAEHPARDGADTFYLKGGMLLRTHTSPVQIRTMRNRKPPLKMVCPGRVYRRDWDATHLPMFHQLEALVVDEGITLGDLKGTMNKVWKQYFGAGVKTRLRPAYFPFVEPGCEYDVSCQVCNGDGCRICKHSGWIELGGAGMVHPAIFEAAGVDPEKYTGFAFGLGIDRIAMMKYGIDDLRLMMENDARFLGQFPW
jgi:phenylalanyl-tRNA synthetase alpha chain